MARAENFNKVMKRDKTGCLERMKLSSCVNFPRVSASSGEATAFPRGTSGHLRAHCIYGPFCLTWGKWLNDKTPMNEAFTRCHSLVERGLW